METMPRSTPGLRSFEDFVPSSEWVRDKHFENLLINLPGFKKEQIKVQIDNYRNLRTSGERPLDGYRWSRFRKEFNIPENLNISEIRAKFENGILSVMLPKLITQAEPQDPLATEIPAIEPKTGSGAPEVKAAVSEPESVKSSTGTKPEEARKEKEKDRAGEIAAGANAGEAADAGKKRASPPPSASPAISGGVDGEIGAAMAKATESSGEIGAVAARTTENSVGDAGDTGAATTRARVSLRMRKPRQVAVNVAVAVMVMLGIGIYLSYKWRKGALVEESS